MEGNGNELDLSARLLFVHSGLLVQIVKSKVNCEFHRDDSVPHVEIKFQERYKKIALINLKRY